MGTDDLLKTDKLTINAYATAKRDGEGEPLGSFSAVFSLSSYSRRFENVFQSGTSGINTSGRAASYLYSQPSRLTFQLLLDNTGLHKTSPVHLDFGDKTVEEQLANFLEVCQQYDGEIHQPRFLIVQWGTLAFRCRLVSVEVNYTLFDKGGTPLRAELNTVFVEDMTDEERTKQEDKKSPDITRVRTFKAGDTLPALALDVYGSADYYLLLARANDIDHFREIQPGRDLIFPPLDKLMLYATAL